MTQLVENIIEKCLHFSVLIQNANNLVTLAAKKYYEGTNWHVAIKNIENLKMDTLEIGSIHKINFIYRNKQIILDCELIDDKIVETIPKRIDNLNGMFSF